MMEATLLAFFGAMALVTGAFCVVNLGWVKEAALFPGICAGLGLVLWGVL